MKRILLLCVVFCCNVTTGHSQHCGVEQLEEEISKSTELRRIKDSVNVDMIHWLKTAKQSRLRTIDITNPHVHGTRPKSMSRSLCGYNNTFVIQANAPTTVGSGVLFTNLYGGDYFRVNNMQANRTYRITTCGQNDFDTQLTIYPAGGGNAVAHNDDACANYQSEILFSPQWSGSYDVLVDEYDCDWTILVNTDVLVELVYEYRPVVTLPVVFHVVHNTAEQNVSDLVIANQLNILNEHFMRYQSSLQNVPAAFRGQSSSPLIQFCRAQQDPDGNPTNGITRTSTDVTEFTGGCGPDIPCLYSSDLGGKDEWDRSKYINIWVANLGSSLGGVGFSGHPVIAELFSPLYRGLGIAVNYQAFGSISNNLAPDRQHGRTTIHEMGHFFGLWHMWGNDDNVLCATDSISDTPLQSGPTFGLETFPYTDECAPNYPGRMFHNYMDYSDDLVTNMFTYYQTARMDYALFNWYSSLVESSGCQVPVITDAAGLTGDFKMAIRPNPFSEQTVIEFGKELKGEFDIEILDMLGRTVQSIQRVVGDRAVVNADEMQKGVYVAYLVNSRERVLIGKMVVQ